MKIAVWERLGKACDVVPAGSNRLTCERFRLGSVEGFLHGGIVEIGQVGSHLALSKPGLRVDLSIPQHFSTMKRASRRGQDALEVLCTLAAHDEVERGSAG